MIRATTTSGSTTMIEHQAVDDLVTDIDGEVIGPDDVGYDEARRVWNGMIDRRPAPIVRVDALADMVRAAYGEEKRRRLVEVKNEYDPNNLFRRNQNIKPDENQDR